MIVEGHAAPSESHKSFIYQVFFFKHFFQTRQVRKFDKFRVDNHLCKRRDYTPAPAVVCSTLFSG